MGMPTIEKHNAEEIAKLRRWRLRSSILFFASLIEMPLTLIVACGVTGFINMHNLGLQYAQISMLCAILLPLVGLAGVLLMRFDRRHSARALEIARLADERGLRYTYQPDGDDLAFMAAFKFINLERVMEGGSGKNLMQGTFKKRPLTAVDYSYNHFYGNKVLNTQQTIVVFTEGFDSLPEFVVVKQWFGEKLEQLIAGTPFGKKFKIPDEDEFNQHFIVAGNERKEILACLTSQVIDRMLDDHRLTFLIQDGMLLVARQGTIISEREYEDFLLAASKLARELSRDAQ